MLGTCETQVPRDPCAACIPTTAQALERIVHSTTIEEQIRGRPAELRREVRQTRARPLLDEFEKWMEKAVRRFRRKARPRLLSAMRSPHGAL